MPDFYLVIDLLVVFALLGLGVTVLVKNRAAELNRIFALFVVCIGVWIIANYISNDIKNTPQTAVIANYFVFSFSYAASIFLLRFGIILAGDTKAKRLFRKVQIPLYAIALAGATPLVVAGAHIQGELYAVEFGPVTPVYFVTLILNIAAVVYVIRRNIKRTHGDQRNRLKLLFKSLCWTFPVLLLAQAILPATTGWFGLTNVGILPMLILVFGLYYGVVKHRLFDLRLIIVRTLVYGATLGVISVAYGVVTHYAATALTNSNNVLVRDLANVGLIIIAVVAYAPLKRIFNKLTNRFFYQDAYDPQEFFNKFNESLVANAQLEKLLQSSTSLIATTLKADFCLITLLTDDPLRPRIVGTVERSFTLSDIEKGTHLLANTPGTLIATDYLDTANEPLNNLLVKNDISVLARMSVGGGDPELGYVILGRKKSGNPYNTQDMRVIETVTNELVIAVQNALRFEEIEQFAITLQERVEDATKKLRQTNDKLRALDQTKDDFISMASHQLRTPLTSIKGYVSMVLDGDAGPVTPQQKKMLGQAFISSQRMVYLISDLLNVSRLKTGKFVIEPVQTNLAKVIQDEVEQLQETAKSRNLTLTYNKPAHFPTLVLDETKLRQVIMNFMDNAIYYTPQGGHIAVNLVDKPLSIEFTVVDDGIGVPKHEQHHLFSKFYRAHNAKRARPDGTGLGLFMAKKVIVAQGGAIIFRSQEKKGSTFGFTFAKAKVMAAPEKQIQVKHDD